MDLLRAQFIPLWGYCGSSSVQEKIRVLSCSGSCGKGGTAGQGTGVLRVPLASAQNFSLCPLTTSLSPSSPPAHSLSPRLGSPAARLLLGKEPFPWDTQHGDVLWVAHHSE